MWQKELVKLIEERFQAHKRINPKYSIRAYAKRLGLSPGSLSDLLLERKTWNISSKRGAAILENLGLKPSVKNRFLVKMGEAPVHTIKELTVFDYEMLADESYALVLAAFDLPPDQRTSLKIGKRLGLEKSKIEKVIHVLLERGFLAKDAGGEIHRPDVFIRSSTTISDDLHRQSHEANLGRVLHALNTIDADKRDFTSLTFAGGKTQMEFLRREIRKLHEKASALMDAGGEKDQVFRLSVQLFPIEFKRP